ILLEALGTGDALATLEHLGQAAVDVAVEDRLLVVAVLGQPFDLFALDGERALVLLDAVAVGYARLRHGAPHAPPDPQRRGAHGGGLLPRDPAPPPLLPRHRAVA